ncbi:MAG: PLP-dependent aspartate aminotransferase family protein [Cyanobacteria bacterium]|nr:PLP-dependent aspartate aminotransferase family protein [Cyanobacteriota bacterium]
MTDLPNSSLHLETLAVHAGRTPDPTTGAIAAPIHLSTTFARDDQGEYSRGFVYSRLDNPNRRTLEGVLAQLEGGTAAAAFSSGTAATHAALQAIGGPGRILAPRDCYHGTRLVMTDTLAPWGLEVTFVDMDNLAAVAAAAMDPTAAPVALIWVETPSNPLLKVTDIVAIAAIARDVGALLVCDNTWATPLLQRPLALGADLVVHSTTKYLGGHGDVLGGAVIGQGDHPAFGRVRQIQQVAGAVPSPFDCWLLLRSLQTLPLRMRAHCDNARYLARHWAAHPAVERVYYPGLATHPGCVVAARQMSDFGGMLSIAVRGDRAAAQAVVTHTQLFGRATSLGGTESLIEHRASLEGPNSTTPENLLRVSVGLERMEDLAADLDRALSLALQS